MGLWISVMAAGQASQRTILVT
ncbi:hypothetical protein Goklo_014182, partial [Gossypium klotzschianum]|nr:hypothetical protein [Gossypium klotzschianum]